VGGGLPCSFYRGRGVRVSLGDRFSLSVRLFAVIIVISIRRASRQFRAITNGVGGELLSKSALPPRPGSLISVFKRGGP
jgi:hypothetical protein